MPHDHSLQIYLENGTLAMDKGDFKTAGRNLLAALRKVRTRREPTEEHAIVLLKLARYYARLERYVHAARYYNQALLACEAHYGIESLPVADVLRQIADLYGMQSKFEQAGQIYMRALNLHSRLPEQNTNWLSYVAERLSQVYFVQQKYHKSERWRKISRSMLSWNTSSGQSS